MSSFGLVLSGGAAFGIANGGVLEILDREELKPDAIAGSSMGAIIGGLYALGLPIAELKKLANALSMRTVASIVRSPFSGGLQGGILKQRLEEPLRDIIGNRTIGECRIPFVCIAGKVTGDIAWSQIAKSGFTEDIRTKVSLHVFPPETRLLDALLATSSIPVLFSPHEIEGERFIDLCHFGPIPSRTLRRIVAPERVIATDTTPPLERIARFVPPAWKEFIMEGLKEAEESRRACDLVLKPEMPAAVFRFDRAKEFWEAGKSVAEENIERIRRTIRMEI